MTVQQVINILIKYSGIPNKLERTCDILSHGDYETDVTGIVTTFMATIDVIRRAAELNCNLIITHEPTWFTGRDDTEWLVNDPVYHAKKQLLDDAGISIWRYHDYMHLKHPDPIYLGIEEKLGWTKHAPGQIGKGMFEEGSELIDKFPFYYDIPETTLGDLASLFIQKLGMKCIRSVGRPSMLCQRVGILVGGASLGLGHEEMPAQLMQAHNIDVMVCGDITEWTLCSYINDAQLLGHNKAMLVVGHERSEEWGMEYLARCLPTIISDVPVYFINAGEPFHYFTR